MLKEASRFRPCTTPRVGRHTEDAPPDRRDLFAAPTLPFWQGTAAVRLATAALALLSFGLLVSCSRSPEATLQRHLNRAQQYYEEDKYPEAVIEYRNAIKTDPNSAVAHYGLGRTAIGLGQFQRAHDEFRRVIELKPDHVDAHVRLAEVYLAARELTQAMTEAQRVLELSPTRPDGHRLAGEIHLHQNEPAAAVESFRRAIELAKNDAAAYQRLALAQIAAGNPGQAEAQFKKAIAINPSDPQAYLNLSRFLRAARKRADAETTLEQAAAAMPNSLSVRLELAAFYLEGDLPAEAERVLNALRNRPEQFPGLTLEIGDLYGRFQLREKALVSYRQALQKEPDDVSAQHRVVEGLLTLGQIDDAEELNQQVLQEDPSDPRTRLNRGRILLARNRTSEAVVTMESVAKDAPASIPAHYYLAMAYLQGGNIPQARSELERCTTLNRKFYPALIRLAEISLRANDPGGAVRFARQALQVVPNAFDAHLALGNAFLQQNDLPQAMQTFRTARRINPQSAAVHERIGFCYIRQNDFRSAERELERALALDSAHIPALADFSHYWVERNQPERAIRRIQQQVAKLPSHPELYYLLAQVQASNRQWRAAQNSLRKAIELKLNYLEAHRMLARILLTEQRPSEVITHMTAVIAANPNDAQSYALLANAYQEQGDWGKATRSYERALGLEPNFAFAANNLAWLYTEHGGDIDVALGWAQRAKQMRPGDPNISDTLAWIYYKKNRYRLAIPLLKEAVATAPDNTGFQLHLGMALFKNGDRTGARRALRQAMAGKLAPQEITMARLALTEMGGRNRP